MYLVIGLTGFNASGKGEVASILERHGFVVHSLSDVIRDEASARGLPPEREHLIRIGNLLRREGGPGVLAERMVSRLVGRDVVDSIRNPEEVRALRELPRFVLLGVRAPAELRFRRSLARARPGDPASLAEFREREAQENSSDPAAQQLEATFALADRILNNHGDLDDLNAAVDAILEELGAPPRDPSESDGDGR